LLRSFNLFEEGKYKCALRSYLYQEKMFAESGGWYLSPPESLDMEVFVGKDLASLSSRALCRFSKLSLFDLIDPAVARKIPISEPGLFGTGRGSNTDQDLRKRTLRYRQVGLMAQLGELCIDFDPTSLEIREVCQN
jgi:hypothetical protein